MNNEKIYVFDFDGVICDSINECMITSYNTYFDDKLYDISKIPQNFALFFYKHRHLIRPAKEYFILCKAFEKKIDLNYSEFDKMKKTYTERIDIFENLFFKKRSEIQKDINLWISYHKIYDESKKFINDCIKEFYILTNKDLNSVNILSKYFNFNEKIKGILSKELSNDKHYLFNYFFRNYSIKKGKKIIYVDDNEDHLKKVSSHPLEIYFAKWGYSKIQRKNNFNEISSLLDLK